MTMNPSVFSQDFVKNQWALAAFAPCGKGWKELKEIGGVNINPLLKSAVFRAIFAIVCFILIIPRIALGESKTISKGPQGAISGFDLAKIFNDHTSKSLPSSKEIAVSNRDTKPETKPETEPESGVKKIQGSTPLTATHQSLKIRNGLENLGNTCYLNSCIQLIASIPEIFNQLLISENNSELKASLIRLIQALTDSSAQKNDIDQATKAFHDNLMNSRWTKEGRGGRGVMNDTFELLHFFSDEGFLKLKNISCIEQEEFYIETDFKTKETINNGQIEKGKSIPFLKLPTDIDNKKIQDLINDQVSTQSLVLYNRQQNQNEIGTQINEKDILYYAVGKLIEGDKKNELLDLFDLPENLFRQNNPKYFDPVTQQEVSADAYIQNKSIFNYILDELKLDYQALMNDYCKDNEKEGVNRFIQRDTTSFQTIKKGSLGIFLSIEKPTEGFDPDRELKVNGDTYKLKAVVRRASGPHYMLCEIGEDGKSGVNYSDSHVEKDIRTSFARLLYYAKI